MRRVLAAALAALVGAGVAAAAAESAKPRPPRLEEWCATKADRRIAFRFKAADGATLVGLQLGPRASTRGVVLVHEGQGSFCNWLPYGRRLARLGYRVLLFDLRGFASSPPARVRRGRHDLDVIGAVRELRQRGVPRVVVVGGSLGAMAALVAGATLDPPVEGVVAVSPALSFRGLDAARAVPSLRVPVLYVAATDDGEFVPFAQRLYEQTASTDKRLVVVAGDGHGNQLVRGVDGAANRELIETFLRERLGG